MNAYLPTSAALRSGLLFVAANSSLAANAPTLIQQKLIYETTAQGLGWYYFHHHHMHVSFRP